MTANELIDSAKEIHTTIEALEFVQKAIPLLRQQQAEIEALKQKYELYGAVWHDEHGYQFTATVGEKVLNDDRWIKLYRKRVRND